MILQIKPEALDEELAKEGSPSLFGAMTSFNALAKGRFTIKMHETHGSSGQSCFYFFVYPAGNHLKLPIGFGVPGDLLLKLAFLPVEKLTKYLTSDNEAVQELLKLRLE